MNAGISLEARRLQTHQTGEFRHTLKTHDAAPDSTNSERLKAKPAREGFVSMCASTEPFRTGIGAVCVECGRPKWPITMLHTVTEK